ncbi:MAG: type II toxin-antitoxin system RatA family toxin [Hydrogenovibrio sp.]
MKKISRSALLPYSAEAVFDLVNDVGAYPEFLPWCGGAQVLEASETHMVASVVIAKAGVRQTFTTRNALHRPSRIEMQLVDGPFKQLHGIWQFTPLTDEACKIAFDIEFEISNRLLNVAIGPIFEQIVTTLVQSFCERAKQVYG